MPRILYLTAELPYFPGQGGVMALHIGHLAKTQIVGVAGPRYARQPEDALQKLRDTAQHCYWWPEHPLPGDIFIPPELWHHRTAGLRYLPPRLKRWVWRRLTGLNRLSDDALPWLVVMRNLAPKFLEALRSERWNVVLLSQSTSVAWLRYLPATLARCIYFHDIRSDYLRRNPAGESADNLRRVKHEEQTAAREADALAFVSELDRDRALKLLQPAGPSTVAPICIDLEYFIFRPDRKVGEFTILFSGHLSHPPNIDAVMFFLDSIWPTIAKSLPSVRLRIVGLQPSPRIRTMVAQAIRTELFENVPDIRPYLDAAHVYVVPMRYGGGVRQKIVEAMGVGLPVVTTMMGAEGIAAVDGENCWIRDKPEEFAAMVIKLLEQPAPSIVIHQARKLVETEHSSAVSSPRLASQLKVALSRRQQSAPRILYDLRWLEPGKVGGIEQMTRELIEELAAFDRDFAYRFHGSRRACARWKFPRFFRHKMILNDDRRARWLGWRDQATEQLAGELGLPSLASRELRALEWYARLDFTVIHGLAGHVHQDLRRFPSVVTMHDLQHLHRPEFFRPTDIAAREKEYRESCQLAGHIICISEFTRQDVHRRYGIPLEKMTTIWNLPPRLTGAPMSPSVEQNLLRQMGIKAPFLFFPSHPWLHKNHLGLLKAMDLARSSLPSNCQLVLAGQPLPPNHAAFDLLVDLTAQRRVIHLGYRSPLEISALYGSATALVFPSLFEGFGMPIIEAMQRNCPVVCGQHSSLQEIAGDAALYTEVESPTAMAEAMAVIVRDANLRIRLKNQGRINLQRFNRRQLAEKTRSIYTSVHEQHFS